MNWVFLIGTPFQNVLLVVPASKSFIACRCMLTSLKRSEAKKRLRINYFRILTPFVQVPQSFFTVNSRHSDTCFFQPKLVQCLWSVFVSYFIFVFRETNVNQVIVKCFFFPLFAKPITVTFTELNVFILWI